MIDKRGVLANAESLSALVLEFGCGPQKRYSDAVGIDAIDSDAVDIIGDAGEVLRALPPGCARLVTSAHFFEHLDDAGEMLDAMKRVLAEDGRIEVIVPHFSSPYYYSDPTHRNGLGFGLYTMSYFAHDPLLRRQTPSYVRRPDLVLESIDLRFKSPRPFVGRYAVKRVIGALFNSTTYLQEFWEENLCYVFPCYEIRYTLRRGAIAPGEPA